MTLAKVKEQDGMTLAKVKEQDGMTHAKVKEQDGMISMNHGTKVSIMQYIVIAGGHVISMNHGIITIGLPLHALHHWQWNWFPNSHTHNMELFFSFSEIYNNFKL